MDVYFYEAFEEEADALKSLLGNQISYELTDKTIQESGHVNPPARLISIRTQSVVPIDWANKIDGILSRSKIFRDHSHTTPVRTFGRVRHTRCCRTCYSVDDGFTAAIAATDEAVPALRPRWLNRWRMRR